ncbi:hypothetical protein [Klebsiella aerogenes]|nr:hypothetical protein [Klebsiella aerogenes]UWC48080.1 hypothetical protein M5S98_06515 [Klebsiella aerogenes]HCJ5310906.1 hypothetical protein [Klebsiella aerogenes]
MSLSRHTSALLTREALNRVDKKTRQRRVSALFAFLYVKDNKAHKHIVL